MKQTPEFSTLPPILLTSIAPVLWGTTYLVTSEYLPSNVPLLTATIRTLPAGLLLVLLSGSFAVTLPWRRLLLLSVLNFGAFQAFLFVAAYRLPGGIAAVVGALQPLLALALAWGFDRYRPNSLTTASAIAGLVGMTLLFLSPATKWDSLGISAAFVGTASMALGTFLSRRWRNGMPLLRFTGWQLGLGGLLLFPLALLIESPLPDLTASNWVAYGYLSILGTLFAYSLWFWGISKLSLPAVSALGLLSPITAITLGWLALGQTLGPRAIVGSLIVLLSVGTLQASEALSRRTQPKPVKPKASRFSPTYHSVDIEKIA